MAACRFSMNLAFRKFHTTAEKLDIQKMSRLRVVDNSAIGKQAMLEGKPPKCIHVYSKKRHGYIGESKTRLFFHQFVCFCRKLEFLHF